MRIGLVTDTHLPALYRQLDELGPEAAAFFATVDLILHAGDVTSPSILDWLEQFAPVLVAQGNNDDFADPRMRPVQHLDVEGWRIGMVHNLAPEHRPVHLLRQRHFDPHVTIMIAGHTHLERLEHRDGAVIINSGSPILPHHKDTRHGTVGLLELAPGRLHAEILLLGHTEGRRNPATPMSLDLEVDVETSKLTVPRPRQNIHQL
ncbi:MAG: metallophosphoesterase family protein [Dehalococcoidia bacterium]